MLTWWEGSHAGYGQGEYVILDHSYREITRVRAGNGYEGDHHEFLITPEDTALITIYNKVPRDLSGAGGPVDGYVLDGIVQEIDIETGEVLFEWHSLDHIGLEESYYEPFDYFHINSIDVYRRGSPYDLGPQDMRRVQGEPQDGRGRLASRRQKSDFEMGKDVRRPST